MINQLEGIEEDKHSKKTNARRRQILEEYHSIITEDHLMPNLWCIIY